MLKLPLILLFVTCILFPRAQQDIKNFTLQNIHPITTIDPASDNDTDLAEIGKAIGNARIVMLGEQDHGDAPSFLAKTRIIKYLHKKMGFDVLVYEGDFWALNQVGDKINDPAFGIDSIRDNTYDIWSQCVQVQPLYNYINSCRHDAQPLLVTGMDCRHAGPYSKLAYVAQFDSAVLQKSVYTGHTAVLNHFNTVLSEVINREFESQASKADQRFFLSMLDTLSATSHMGSFWTQELINLKAGAENAWLGYGLRAVKSPLRDIQMADNLNWLYHYKYAGKKLIVWAHNIHISRNTTFGKRKIYFYNQTTGNEIYSKLKDTVYSIGFTSYSGSAGRLPYKPYKINPPRGECFENWVHSKNMNYGFINFKSYTGHALFKMQGLQHWDVKANWTNIFDGVFYVQDMYPCDKTP